MKLVWMAAAGIGLLGTGLAAAATLTTPHYVVQVTAHCAEGAVTCEAVSYLGRSRTSGRSIRLQGETLHARCADGITPCRFLGYRFRNGAVTYEVLESGRLRVTEGPRVLIDESGDWSYAD